jgi:phage tail sheath gpL-like
MPNLVSFDLVPATQKSSAVYVEQKYVLGSLGSLLIPHKIAILGQYNSGKTPTNNVAVLVTSEADAINLYGRGSLMHLLFRKALAGAGNVPIYCIPLADGTTAAAGTMIVNGAATTSGVISLYVAGQRITIPVTVGDSANTIGTNIAAAINAAADLPVTAAGTATVTCTARNKGAWGNALNNRMDLSPGEAAAEPTITGGITLNAYAAGATDPDPTTALAALGDTWYTFIVCPYDNIGATTVALAAMEASFTARLDPAIKRPFIGCYGNVETAANLITRAGGRNSPGTAYINAEGSPNIPGEIAAAFAGTKAARAQAGPGRTGRGMQLLGIKAGAVALWTGVQREAVVAAGGSTSRWAADGTVYLIDGVTSYKTNSQAVADESFRFISTLENLQVKIYSLENLFSGTPFDDAIVVDDAAVTSVQYAIRPKTVKGFLIKLIDELWVPYGLTKNRDLVVAGIITEIDSGNGGRINALVPDVFSSGLRVMAGKIQWSLYPPSVAA